MRFKNEIQLWEKLKEFLPENNIKAYRIENSVSVGMPDVLLTKDGMVIPLELKIYPNNLHGSQIGWFLEYVKSNNSPAIVLYGNYGEDKDSFGILNMFSIKSYQISDFLESGVLDTHGLMTTIKGFCMQSVIDHIKLLFDSITCNNFKKFSPSNRLPKFRY